MEENMHDEFTSLKLCPLPENFEELVFKNTRQSPSTVVQLADEILTAAKKVTTNRLEFIFPDAQLLYNEQTAPVFSSGVGNMDLQGILS
jgi:hypothetical protein